MEGSRMSQRERHKTSHEFYLATFSLGMSAQQCTVDLNHKSE